MIDPVGEFLRKALDAEYALIETEMEKAVQGGRCGVKVTRDRWGWLISASVDSEVPYGVIYEHWIEGER